MSLLPVSAIPVVGYHINNSLRLRNGASAYLQRTFSTTTGASWTYSVWLKRGELSSEQTIISARSNAGNSSSFYFNTSNQIIIWHSEQIRGTSTALFRDPSAWYHVVIEQNATTVTVYVNNVSVVSWTGVISRFNTSGVPLSIGADPAADATRYADTYIAEAYFVDGQALTPSSFGETNATTGVWQPKAYTGTYGNNGFYLKFSSIALTSGSNTGLGQDFSGNGNFYNTTNISVTAGTTYDAMIDSPTLTSGTVGNYCVLNSISNLTTSSTSRDCNLSFVTTPNAGDTAVGSIGMSSGKWYWEAQTSAQTTTSRAGVYGTAASAVYSFAANNTVYGFRFDADAGTLDYTTNGSSFTSLATGLTSGPYFPYFIATTSISRTISVNFGQRPFTYTPPTGYVALNTFNLPTSTIVKGNIYMDATLWLGNSTSPRSITNAASFRPDLVWIKNRSTVDWHGLYDVSRGVNNVMYSNTTASQQTNEPNGYISAFNSNGFSVTAGSSGSNNVNASTRNYVGWQWQAGSSAVTNTSGTISAQVRANTTAGFSIVTYTGTGANATVGHGLGVAPAMVIVKRRNSTGNWQVRHTSIAAANSIQLNLTNASAAATTVWNSTAPTSTVFSIGTSTDVNANTGTYVAYCWTQIAGFSAFGSYTGNASVAGPFVYTGFRPKYIMIKKISGGTAGGWTLIDTSRSTFNIVNDRLVANDPAATETINMLDIVSNGFKVRVTSLFINEASLSFLYMAFAENPFKNALAR